MRRRQNLKYHMKQDTTFKIRWDEFQMPEECGLFCKIYKYVALQSK